MRKIFAFLVVLFISFATALAGVHRVGTYNTRWPSTNDTGDKSWGSRREAVYKMIRDTMKFDVVALQEVSSNNGYDPETDLRSNLSNVYTFVKGDHTGNLLLYRTSKYECLAKGSFDLIPSPKPKGWDADQTRWTVWAKLKDKKSGEIFYFGATHQDLYPVSIREGARINAEKMYEIAGDYPCMFAGDMNCYHFDHDPHANFGIYFGNARQMSKTEPKGSFYTFASGMDPKNADRQIDFLYVRNTEVESYFVNNSTLGRSLMPSDHMPMVCEVTLLPSSRKTTHAVKNVSELRQAAKTIQPNDIIYLRDGTYDLGDSTLTLANTCVVEGSRDAILTGSGQLLAGNQFISVELRGFTIRGASCNDPLVKGSLIYFNGKYLTLTDCLVEDCYSKGTSLIYSYSCTTKVDHCVFRNNQVANHEGCIHIESDQADNRCPVTIQNCLFANNTANNAPAIYYCSESQATIDGNSFINNTSKVRGAVVIEATKNTSTISMVNNTFIGNTINVKSSMRDNMIGGSAIYHEMPASGSLKLINNTIVGNYTASRSSSGVASKIFKSGAVQSSNGKLQLINNIIAGNYSSATGLGDVSMKNDSLLIKSEHNLYSSADNMNITATANDFVAASYAAACAELVSLLGGQVNDSVYVPNIKIYGEDQDVFAISPLVSTYASQNIAVCDITQSGIPTLDQSGVSRNAKTVPGAMEAGIKPTQLRDHQQSTINHQQSKILLNGQLYIWHNDRLYNILGF